MSPRGFRYAAAGASIKGPGRNDMALIYSEAPALAAGAFTTNKVKSPTVTLNRERVRRGRGRAVLVNSGNANACTGAQGVGDAREMASLAAESLSLPAREVYVCSTGVIGVSLPMARVRRGIEALARDLGSVGLMEVARAIMTTDTVPKVAHRTVKVGAREATLSAVAKGAGMIEPRMATMLAFFMTDLAVEGQALKAAFREAVEQSFNRITVDGDCSTNDTALILANGMAGNMEITTGSRHYKTFVSALSDLAADLARMVVLDAEGATKLIEVDVRGAKSDAEALRAAKAVANSLLVKTAVYGADPNPGRIMAALGASGSRVKEELIDVSLGRVTAIRRGVATGLTEEARAELGGNEVRILISLGVGRGSACVLTSDLTEEYVKINAAYTT
ncbi:MAG: bifunctional glutamate N-acetyltransferase/amino-acid acetyltransferase ArgJ [Nitrospirota bacterium]